jgi:hypothetical protein
LTKFAPCLDIDVTDPAAADAVEALAREHFEERGAFLVRFGQAPKRAVLLRTDEPFSKLRREFTARNGSTHKIEVLADGQQVVGFGIHPETKQAYRWHGGSPAEIAREELPYIRQEDAERFLDAAAALVVEQFGFTDRGGKAAATDEEPGGRDRPLDWGEAFARIYVGTDLHDTITALAASFVAAGMTDTGTIERLRSLLTASQVPKDARWRDRYNAIPAAVRSARVKFAPAAAVFDPWERYVVPDFPLDVLGPVLAEFVEGQSCVTGCCRAGMAMATLGAVSGAISHRFSLKMMEYGDWYEHPRIWPLLVGDPSTGKTPGINAAIKPLDALQAERLRNHREAAQAHKNAGGKDDDGPEPPALYIVRDVTIEALADILARTGGERGVLVHRDEIAGWVGQMEKYASGRGATADRGFWLKAFDGGPYSVHRIKRGEAFIPNLSCSLIGGIQPDRIAEISGLTSDGLLQRFIPAIMTAADFPLDAPIRTDPYRNLVRQLAELPPQHLTMTNDARDCIKELRIHTWRTEQAFSSDSAFQSFLGKLPGIAGRLALILHLTEHPEERFVGRTAAEKTSRLIRDFIIPHAYEFYHLGELSSQIKRLASYVLTANKPRLVASDFTTNIRDLRGRPLLEVNERLSILVASGWLEPAERTPTCHAWTVNPAVLQQFKRRAQEEAMRKEIIVELIRNTGKDPKNDRPS